MNTIRDHLESVREQIAAAESAAGRPAGSVRLLAVSKTFPAEDVAEAFACGQTCFGENRVQELASKVPVLPAEIEWHLIGSLQSNKAAKAASLASWIHSVDSEKLVRKISAAADALGRTVNILFEVNSGEENKTGFRSTDALRASLEAGLALPGIRVRGLMTMAPLGSDEPALHRVFAALRTQRDALEREFGIELPELSMGMSGDFREAIAEGATIVRIGTAIFGGRAYPAH
ncbi:MAG: YggS family pyridoxal phosphate-dependent enzyme [Lentisphaeria bacterium]|nr:YggS family pyridoxal phosphate-dependent enzyme [Lentisphaeria bacterium]